MLVFNPEHTLHPPGHAVHMSGKETTASRQCLIPGWICLNQLHAWKDICSHRRYRSVWCSDCFTMISSDSHQCLFVVVQCRSVGSFGILQRCRVKLSVYFRKAWHVSNPWKEHGKSQSLIHDSVLPWQRVTPTPIPTKQFATCHIFPLFRIRNRCWCVCLCECVCMQMY